MNMVYKIYTTLKDTPENPPMYNELTADYINRNYSHDDLLVFKQDIVKNKVLKKNGVYLRQQPWIGGNYILKRLLNKAINRQNL